MKDEILKIINHEIVLSKDDCPLRYAPEFASEKINILFKDQSEKLLQSFQSNFGDLIQFVIDNLDCEEREVIYTGASPSMDVLTETKHKYKITLSKIEHEEKK